jgi:hypothetical protein
LESGKIKTTEYEKNKDTDAKKLMANVEISDSEDVQEIEVVSLPGIKIRPLEGNRTIIIKCGGGYKVSVAIDDNIDEEIEEGEVLIFGNDNGSISSSIKLLTDGTIEINSGSNFMVRYNELETAFNELKEKHNALALFVDSHAHTLVTPGSGNSGPVPAPSGATSSADITGSKIEEIKVP